MSEGGARDRLFRGYGPLIGFAAVFLAVAVLVPSQQREVRVDTESSAARRGVVRSGTAADDAAGDATVEDTVLEDPTGGGSDGSGTAGGPGSAGAAGAGAGAAGGCSGPQVPGDPYSPPCAPKFSGDNGGATSRGVTKDQITVSVRIGSFANGMLDALSNASPAAARIPKETEGTITRTVAALVDYFNKRFEFYGRKLKLVTWNGKGDVLQETMGRGNEGAQADALNVAQGIQAFADISAVSPVYADALASQHVINIGVPYTSKQWMNARAPYSWSQFTDCSTVVSSVASYYAIKMAGRPAALAGGDLKNQPRKAMIIAPENSWYQECVQAGINILKQAGKDGDLVGSQQYQVDIPRMSDQAVSLVQKLKAAQTTTVVCGCDPVLLSFLTTKAKEQNYFPEWLVTGVALVDNDMIGQILQQDEWGRAFGVSFSGPSQPNQRGLGYLAYKSIRPDEPSVAVELIYNQLYLLAIGIQGAGPGLTPASFQKGMFDYPRRTGPFGSWGFGPNDYTTSDDAREVFWDPNATSVQTGTKGAYIDPNFPKRFPIGQWPANPPRSALG